MRKHVQLLGILNIVWGSLFVFGALILIFIFGGTVGLIGALSHEPDAHIAMPILSLIGGVLAVFLLLLSIPSILAGIGLLRLAPWSRILGIVVSALHLFNIPLGTALGIYGLWVLLSNETVSLFEPAARPVNL